MVRPTTAMARPPAHKMEEGDVVYYKGSIKALYGQICTVAEVRDETDFYEPGTSSDAKAYTLIPNDRSFPVLYRVRRQSFVYLEWNVQNG